MNRNIRIAKELVRIARSLVAMNHDEKINVSEQFKNLGLAGFFIHCDTSGIDDALVSKFVELLKNSKPYPRVYDCDKFIPYLKYLDAHEFGGINDFTAFVDDPAVRRKYARETSTSGKMLSLLAEDDDYMVKELVAKNKSTPAEALLSLSCCNDEQVRRNVAMNESSTADVLDSVVDNKSGANDDSLPFVAQNPNTGSATLGKLLDIGLEANDDTMVSYVAMHANTSPSDIKRIIEAGGEVENWTRLNHSVLWYIAENGNTPVNILEKLAKELSGDLYMRAHLAKNPNIPDHILDALLNDENEYVRNNARKNKEYRGGE